MLCASWATLDASAPRLQSRAGHEPEPDPTRREVPFDDGDLREVLLRARHCLPAFDDGLALERLRHDLILDQADRPQLAAAERDLEVGRRDRCDPDRLAHPFGDLDPRDLLDRTTVLENRGRLEGHEVGKKEEVGDVAGRDRTMSKQPVPDRRVVRRHEQCVLGCDSRCHGLANHSVDVARVGDVVRVAVVRAERDAPRSVLLDER